MTAEEFAFLSNFLKIRSGLILTVDKKYLLESRLTPVARAHGKANIGAVIEGLRRGGSAQLERDVTEAMTTNESFFFRDVKPFEIFRQSVLPRLIASRGAQRQARIWCAAASSGQEPYSLAMILKEEAAKLAGWRLEIVGTDISRQILDRAQSGIYTQFEVQRGLSIQLLAKYFTKKDNDWEISADIRRMVAFREFNLLSDPASLGRFDVVFCRNVLIYFDRDTKAKVLDGIARQMSPDGTLFLGGAETVLGITESFKPIDGQRGTYSPAGKTAPVLLATPSLNRSQPCL